MLNGDKVGSHFPLNIPGLRNTNMKFANVSKKLQTVMIITKYKYGCISITTSSVTSSTNGIMILLISFFTFGRFKSSNNSSMNLPEKIMFEIGCYL